MSAAHNSPMPGARKVLVALKSRHLTRVSSYIAQPHQRAQAGACQHESAARRGSWQ